MATTTFVGTSSAATLKATAEGSGLSFGSAVNGDMLTTWPAFAELVRQQCAIITPELALKWGLLEPEAGDLRFARMDAIASFARANGLRVRGHTLIWHQSTPVWALARLRARPDWTLVGRFFASVIPRYGDVVDEWDVVNEPIDPDGEGDGLRESPLKQAFGAGYVGHALEEARLYAPHARLMINEFGLEGGSASAARKRALFLGLVRRLKAQGAPLDGVGIQSHLDLSEAFDAVAFADFLRSLADLGLRISLTELDVKERDYAAPMERRDAEVAQAVGAYLRVALAQTAVRSLLTWGLTDLGSWLGVTPADRARFPTAWRDGTGPGLNRGLPYDSDLRPKPMRSAIIAALLSRGV